MAGRLPSNLINMELGVASCSLSLHTLTETERKSRADKRSRSGMSEGRQKEMNGALMDA